MRKYIIRRLLLFIPVLFIFSALLFVMLRVLPGDVVALYLNIDDEFSNISSEEVERLRADLGLDRPLVIQYAEWQGNVLRGNLGHSLSAGRPVAQVIRKRFPVSLQLGVMGLLFAYLVSVPAGIVMAIRQDTATDYVLRVFNIIGLAMPTFLVGILIILILSRGFGWLPSLGYVDFWTDPATNLTQMVWPAIATGSSAMGLSSRIVRSSMLEVLRQDYMRTAAAKGLSPRTQLWRHALRNALIPVMTLFGIGVAHIASGTVVTEVLFGLPGMGPQLLHAINVRDFPLVQGIVLVIAVWVLLANLVVDLLYPVIDPRIKYS